MILKRGSKDIDILVIGSGIDFANIIAEKINGRIHVFKKYGTAMLKTKDYEIEFVGARKESYKTESRKPSIVCSSINRIQSEKEIMLCVIIIENFNHVINTLITVISRAIILSNNMPCYIYVNSGSISETSLFPLFNILLDLNDLIGGH